MSKIIGFQITENKKWETTNEKTGEVRSGTTNRVTFHCEVRLTGDDSDTYGTRGKSYVAEIKDLPRIFGEARPVDGKLKPWLESFCNRHCALETAARAYGDNFSGEELVGVYFFPTGNDLSKK
jgi:hypothetical protein